MSNTNKITIDLQGEVEDFYRKRRKLGSSFGIYAPYIKIFEGEEQKFNKKDFVKNGKILIKNNNYSVCYRKNPDEKCVKEWTKTGRHRISLISRRLNLDDNPVNDYYKFLKIMEFINEHNELAEFLIDNELLSNSDLHTYENITANNNNNNLRQTNNNNNNRLKNLQYKKNELNQLLRERLNLYENNNINEAIKNKQKNLTENDLQLIFNRIKILKQLEKVENITRENLVKVKNITRENLVKGKNNNNVEPFSEGPVFEASGGGLFNKVKMVGIGLVSPLILILALICYAIERGKYPKVVSAGNETDYFVYTKNVLNLIKPYLAGETEEIQEVKIENAHLERKPPKQIRPVNTTKKPKQNLTNAELKKQSNNIDFELNKYKELIEKIDNLKEEKRKEEKPFTLTEKSVKRIKGYIKTCEKYWKKQHELTYTQANEIPYIIRYFELLLISNESTKHTIKSRKESQERRQSMRKELNRNVKERQKEANERYKERMKKVPQGFKSPISKGVLQRETVARNWETGWRTPRNTQRAQIAHRGGQSLLSDFFDFYMRYNEDSYFEIGRITSDGRVIPLDQMNRYFMKVIFEEDDIIIDNIVEIPSDIYESMEVNYDLMRKRMERISPVKMGEKFLKALVQDRNNPLRYTKLEGQLE